jgi:hypothetical protein
MKTLAGRIAGSGAISKETCRRILSGREMRNCTGEFNRVAWPIDDAQALSTFS